MYGRLKFLTCSFLVACMVLTHVAPASAAYCPFCSAVGQTISEKIDEADVVVMAVLKNQPKQNILSDDDELPKGKFEIVQVLRGDKYVAVGDKFESLLVGRYELETPFMVIGVDAPTIAWSTPMKMTKTSTKYVNDVMALPKSGGDRLKFFQDYLQSSESMLAFDAYDEFARAPYADLIEMKDDMIHDDLIKWIQDPEIPVNRKRLYYTMLGVCATQKDLALFEDILSSGDRKRQRGLDALVACYLNIKGKDGLKLINEEFLNNQDSEYVDVFAVISALRFHGAETDKIKKEELVKSMRLVLNRPKMADMVIPDLARWEDWTVAEKLVEMFKTPPKESSSFIRVPIVSYLLACPKPEAKKYIEELRKVDAESVLRAEKMLQWEMGLDWDDDDSDDDESDDEKTGDEKTDGAKAGNADKTNPFESDPSKSSQGETGQAAGGKTESIETGNTGTTELIDPLVSAGSVGTLSFDQDPLGDFESGSNIEMIPEDDKPVLPVTSKAAKDNSQAEKGGSKTVTVPVPVDKSSGDPGNEGIAKRGKETFVSTPANSTGPTNSTGSVDSGNPGQIETANPTGDSGVETESAAPVATQTWQGTAAIVMIPMTVCIFLFLLSWSVINGWFERLIY